MLTQIGRIILKVVFVAPIILFIDLILIVLIGCAGDVLGLCSDFFCGPYCIFAKTILGLSLIVFLGSIVPEIIQMFNWVKNAKATKKQESL